MRFNPDNNLRALERRYEAVPSPENLVHYWMAKLRSGQSLDLAEIPSEFTSYEPLQQLLITNNQRLTLFGTTYDELLRRVRLAVYLMFDEMVEQEIYKEDIIFRYIGFLPHFYLSSESQHQHLRELGSVPGLLILAVDPARGRVFEGPHNVIAMHFSVYPDDRYPIEGLAVDNEGIFHHGLDHLRLIEANSCIENPNYAPLTIGNFQSVISNGTDCYPLISLYSQVH